MAKQTLDIEATLRAENDNLTAQVSDLKKQNENYVNEINRLTAALKDSNSHLLAYRIVVSDILKRG